MAKVERPDTRNSCWRWTASLAGGGYGQFWIYEARHAIPAHRAAEHRRMAIDKLGERFAGVVFAEAAP
jgi:hypothetical protein